jgi:hypothetical protein
MTSTQGAQAAVYMLSELIGGKARLHGKPIGKLADIVVAEHGKLPEVTHLLVDRPYGYKSLMIPWDKIDSLSAKGAAVLGIDAPEPYEGDPQEGQVRLRDHLLDKKVLTAMRTRSKSSMTSSSPRGMASSTSQMSIARGPDFCAASALHGWPI